MGDQVVRAMAGEQQIRAFAAVTRDMTEEARQRHNTSPAATAALGRLMTAGAIMGSMMKEENALLTLQIKCMGPIARMIVTSDSKGNVKGYVENPDVILPPNKDGKLDVSGALGPGTLQVIRDLGLKEPYVGTVDLQTGEIGDDLTYYFAASEQTPSAVGLGVLMNKDNTVCQSGGFIIQLMPFAEEKTISRLEKNLAEIRSVTSLLVEDPTPEGLLRKVLDGFDIEITERMDTRFHCNCSKERMAAALVSVGRKDLNEMIREGKPIEMNCHFCGNHYQFSTEELKEILIRAK